MTWPQVSVLLPPSQGSPGLERCLLAQPGLWWQRRDPASIFPRPRQSASPWQGSQGPWGAQQRVGREVSEHIETRHTPQCLDSHQALSASVG